MVQIAYAGMTKNFSHPGDRRRFAGFANFKGINIENYNPLKKYDLIVLSQKADLSYFNKLELNGTKLIFDFIDAYFHEKISLKTIFRGLIKYITNQNKYLHLNYKNLIIQTCIKADFVICSTDNQKKEIKKYNKNVEIILDAHQKEIKKINIKKNKYFLKKKKLDLFWEGQGGNISSLKKISKLLNLYLTNNLINFHIVTDPKYIKISGTRIHGNTKKRLYKIIGSKKNIYFYKWNIKNLKKISQKCDLGIIPMIDYKYGMYANKPANKLHLMWRLGLPSLASPSLSNKKSILKSKINLLCYNEKDWTDYLDYFIINREKILKYKRELNKHVKKEYSDKKIFSSWEKVVKKLINV